MTTTVDGRTPPPDEAEDDEEDERVAATVDVWEVEVVEDWREVPDVEEL